MSTSALTTITLVCDMCGKSDVRVHDVQGGMRLSTGWLGVNGWAGGPLPAADLCSDKCARAFLVAHLDDLMKEHVSER